MGASSKTEMNLTISHTSFYVLTGKYLVMFQMQIKNLFTQGIAALFYLSKVDNKVSDVEKMWYKNIHA